MGMSSAGWNAKPMWPPRNGGMAGGTGFQQFVGESGHAAVLPRSSRMEAFVAHSEDCCFFAGAVVPIDNGKQTAGLPSVLPLSRKSVSACPVPWKALAMKTKSAGFDAIVGSS